MNGLFGFATAVAREQAANTRFETAYRRTVESFAISGKTLDEINAEELAGFDAAEAEAINRQGAWP